MKIKAVLTVLALFAGLIWAGSFEALPLPGVVQDFSLGVVGVISLTLGSVVRAFGAAALPMIAMLRVFALPLSFGVLGWLILRELNRARG